MSVATDIVKVLAEVLVPLLELIKSLDDSQDEEELRRKLEAYRRNQPSIRKELQELLDRYSK